MGHSYKDLIAWQKARKLAAEVYRVTQDFPVKEMYGLTAQLRRAAISVVSNIAEGQGRLTKGEFIHFLGQARGSLLEVETQLFVAFDLGYLSEADLKRMERETGDVLGLVNRLIASLRARAAGAET
ncbi:MAG TPA: four helix bundle protein [Terriglobales bacterium]|nr:four helix bundle protein [Terriglobales bacterium]